MLTGNTEPTTNPPQVEQIAALQAENDRLRSALIDVGDTLFRNMVLRLVYVDVATPTQLRKACIIINRALGVPDLAIMELQEE
jgi:hypothetical protein